MTVEHRLCLDGSAGSYAQTPNHADFQSVSGYDVRLGILPDVWQDFTERAMVGMAKGGTTNRFVISLRPDLASGVAVPGAINNRVSASGSGGGAFNSTISTAAPPVTDPTPLNIRITYETTVSPPHFTITYYWKPFAYASALADLVSDAGWALIGNVQSVNASIAPFVADAPLRLGDADPATAGVQAFKGKVYAMAYVSQVGGSLVACPDFTSRPFGAASFIDACGKQWFFGGTGSICVGAAEVRGGFLRQRQRNSEQDGVRASRRNRIQ